jgi:Tol biopolymer transport system component
MKKYVFLIILFTLISPIFIQAAKGNESKIAFLRDQDLWVKVGAKEERVTSGEMVRNPVWSYKGEWLAYTRNEHELWVYNLKSDTHSLVEKKASNYQWSPSSNTIAFQVDSNIHIVSAEKEKVIPNIVPQISNYSWLPDGNGFIVSTQAKLSPQGWGSVEVYKVSLTADFGEKHTELLRILPAEHKKEEFFAISTTNFKFSPDGKWMSFLAVPTASWSMDSNTLCVLSLDGKVFQMLNQMVLHPEWFQWSPSENNLAYIEGEGRMAIQNKQLEIKELPALKLDWTPEGYVDWDFTWNSNEEITISRAKETEWSNDPTQRPLPHLVRIHLKNNIQEIITAPGGKVGDFAPFYNRSDQKLYWIRANREHAEVWKANEDGTDAKKWIDRVDLAPVYYDVWSWNQVVSYHD